MEYLGGFSTRLNEYHLFASLTRCARSFLAARRLLIQLTNAESINKNMAKKIRTVVYCKGNQFGCHNCSIIAACSGVRLVALVSDCCGIAVESMITILESL